MVISLCFVDTPAISTLERACGHPGESALTPSELLAPVARQSGVAGCLFPWPSRHSRPRRSFRWPRWVVHTLRLWAQLRRMKGWTMAHRDLFPRCHLCHFLGALLISPTLLQSAEGGLWCQLAPFRRTIFQAAVQTGAKHPAGFHPAVVECDDGVRHNRVSLAGRIPQGEGVTMATDNDRNGSCHSKTG